MYILNTAILNTKEANFNTDFNTEEINISQYQEAQGKPLAANIENHFETIGEDFDDTIDKNEFQTNASNGNIITASEDNGLADKEIQNLLKFIQDNKDSIKAKLESKEVYKAPVEEEPDSKYDIDKTIDTSSQGEIGDCWLLAGLNSLRYSKDGQDIIKNSITDNKDGTYTVAFKGVNVTCKVSEEDLDKARQTGKYSTGDDDVLLFEVAVEKFLYALQDGRVDSSKFPDDAPEFLYDEKSNPLNGGFPNDMLYLLTGENAEYKTIEDKGFDVDEFYDKIENNPDNSAACLHIKYSSNVKNTYANDIYGNTILLTKAGENHAFSIKSVEGDNITMVNPWNSNDEIVISKKELEDNVLGYEYLAV